MSAIRNANSAKQNKRLEAIQRRYDHEDDEAMRLVMSDPVGRQVLMRVARNCRWMGDPWDANSVRQTDYDSGKRKAGIELMEWIERVNGEAFHLMQQEATARDVAAAQTRAAAVTPSAQEQDEENDDG